MPDEMLTKPLPSEEEQQDFYRKLRVKIDQWIEKKGGAVGSIGRYLLAAPDLFYLLAKLLTDSRIDRNSKAMLGAGLLYFVAPLDFLPEMIMGAPGFIDDVVVAAYVINTLLNRFPIEIIEEHWPGDEDLLGVLRGIADSGNQVVSKLPAGRLVKRFLK